MSNIEIIQRSHLSRGNISPLGQVPPSPSPPFSPREERVPKRAKESQREEGAEGFFLKGSISSFLLFGALWTVKEDTKKRPRF